MSSWSTHTRGESKLIYSSVATISFSFSSFSRALWHKDEKRPMCWQLDPTEGPARVRRRLISVPRTISEKFLMRPETGSKKSDNADSTPSNDYSEGSSEDLHLSYISVSPSSLSLLFLFLQFPLLCLSSSRRQPTRV